jgi:hypothetical protein
VAVNNPTDLSPVVKAMSELGEVVDSRAARIEARLGPDNRAAWSAIGGAVMAVAASAAITLWLAAARVHSGSPICPRTCSRLWPWVARTCSLRHYSGIPKYR